MAEWVDAIWSKRTPDNPDGRIWQGFVAKPADCEKGIEFDRKLYILRREFEKADDKKGTALGVILIVITLLFIAGAIAGLIYLGVSLVKGTLTPATTVAVIVSLVIIVIMIFKGKQK